MATDIDSNTVFSGKQAPKAMKPVQVAVPAPRAKVALAKVSRTIYINKSPMKIGFEYEVDPKDDAGSRTRKEKAFEAALKAKYPDIRRLRSGCYHYQML